ncbi:MAG: Tol-Pal system beta propeller repeat protein TolB [Myxococcota bacterium]
MISIRVLICLFGLLLALPARAQSIVIQVPGAADIPLALPNPELPAGGEPKAAAGEVWDAIWTDLEMSGYFKMQDPKGYVEKGKGSEPGQFDMASWELIKTTVLVKVRVWPAGHANCDAGGGKMCADAYIYNVPTGEKLASKRFRGTSDSVRYLGHAIANKVIEVTMGVPGIFGTRIAAVGSKTGNKEIYAMDNDGHGVVALTRNGAINLSPAWSPDGRSFAWTSYKKANPDLYIKDLPTGRTRTISNFKGVNTSPAFSPDGTIVALARSVEGDADIFLVDSRTGAQIRRLTNGGGIDVSPAFSPDGKSVAFASERSGGSQVYLGGVGGGEAKRITFTGDFNIDPVISPDGKKVAFVGRSQGGFDVYVCDMDGRNLVRLTQDMGDNEDPSWSPDSRYVVFSSTRTGRSELFVSTADGRHQTRITSSGGWTQPSWAPGMPAAQ